MGILLRIVLGGIIFGFFSIVVFSSFFAPSKDILFPEIEKGEYILGEKFGTGSIYKNTYSLYDTVYSTQSGNILNSGGDQETITITSGAKYFTSFRDAKKKYVFQGEGYHIDQEGIGEVYIDTQTSPGKVFIMTLNTPLHLSITNTDVTEEYAHIFLSPHMYIEFQPVRGKFLKNADVVRVETVYKLGYFPERITEMPDDVILQKYNDTKESFLIQSYTQTHNFYESQKEKIESFQDKEISNIPGYNMILRYTNLFVNDEKKEVFYKNMVLEGILEILKLQKYDSGIVSQIQQDLKRLEKYNSTAHKELLDIIDYLGFLVYIQYEKEYIIPKLHFAELRLGEIQETRWYFPIYGFSLYSLYDSGNDFSPWYVEKFLQSFDPFFMYQEGVSSYDTLRYQYFSFFLEEQFSFLLHSGFHDGGIASEINTLQKLIESLVISYGDEATDRVTALYIYNEVLHTLEEYLQEELFLPDRSEEGLLELHATHKLTQNEVLELSGHVDTISKFLLSSSIFLESTNARDISLKQEISGVIEAFSEYFSALRNHEAYRNEYDLTKRNIQDINTIGSGDDIDISEEHAREYLSQFLGISSQSVTIDVVADTYYKISKLYISGKIFSFDLYPYASYRIQNITIDEVPISFVYKLSNIESEWKEKFATATKDERYKYDFSRFFLITFFNDTATQVEQYDGGEIRLNEDKTEIVFKRDILLGDKGEFKSIRNFITIEYDDIGLKKNSSNTYDIFLDNIDFDIEVFLNNQKKRRKGKLLGEYVLNQTDHYFKNIVLQVLVDREGNTKQFEFNGDKVNIIGKINIGDLEEMLSGFLIHMGEYSNAYDVILEKFPGTVITMNYTLYNKKMSFKFDSAGKSYNILLSGGNVTGIYRGIENSISGQIPVSKLKENLQ